MGRNMTRDEGTDIISAILSGGITGFAEANKSAIDMRKEMYREIFKQKLTPKEWKPTTREETLDFEKAKAGIVKPAQEMQQKKTLLQTQVLEQGLSEKKQQQEDAISLIVDTAKENLDTIKTIKEGKKYFGPYANLPTLATSLGGIIDYKNRKKWENNINKLLSQKVVDLITLMKSTSKTGATGFGSLTEQEGQLLREASTALSKDLDPETAMSYLDQMEKIYTKILSKKSLIPNQITSTLKTTEPLEIYSIKRK